MNAFTKIRDVENLKKIRAAAEDGLIDEPASLHLEAIYYDSMSKLRCIFVFLGHAFGTPKTPVYRFDIKTNSSTSDFVAIKDIGPHESYIVHHRFKDSGMMGQFFVQVGFRVRYFVSVGVTLIIAPQKSVDRSITKVIGKYYDQYVDDVLCMVSKILEKHSLDDECAERRLLNKISANLHKKFTSDPVPIVRNAIGSTIPAPVADDIIHKLSEVSTPQDRLFDVYRLTALFDTVPQIIEFAEMVQNMLPDYVVLFKNGYHDLNNQRDYRAAKIIIKPHGKLSDQNGDFPLEIQCHVRAFYDVWVKTHDGYEIIRKDSSASNEEVRIIHEAGIREYNEMICRTVSSLIARIGWNVLYGLDNGFLAGFPQVGKLPYKDSVVDAISAKVKSAAENSIFTIPNTPRELTLAEIEHVYDYLTRYILFAALPYSVRFFEVEQSSDSPGPKLFNFVLHELHRHHKNGNI